MFESQRPQQKPSELHWVYRKVPCGTSLKGWIAGSLVGVSVHWSDGSRPCRLKLTGGKLPCKLCEARVKLRYIGYLPVYDERLYRLVVAVSETVAAAAQGFAFRVPVVIRRTAGARDPLSIRTAGFDDGAHLLKVPGPLSRAAPADIRPWLLHLWNDPELIDFYDPQPKFTASDLATLAGSDSHNGGYPPLVPSPLSESSSATDTTPPTDEQPARNGRAKPRGASRKRS